MCAHVICKAMPKDQTSSIYRFIDAFRSCTISAHEDPWDPWDSFGKQSDRPKDAETPIHVAVPTVDVVFCFRPGKQRTEVVEVCETVAVQLQVM